MLIWSPMGPKILPVLRVTELTRVFSQENARRSKSGLNNEVTVLPRWL